MLQTQNVKKKTQTTKQSEMNESIEITHLHLCTH